MILIIVFKLLKLLLLNLILIHRKVIITQSLNTTTIFFITTILNFLTFISIYIIRLLATQFMIAFFITLIIQIFIIAITFSIFF